MSAPEIFGMAEQQQEALEREFRSWVAEQPADREYNYFDNCGCAFAAFLRETGVSPDARVGGFGWGDKDNVDANPFSSEDVVYALSRSPHAFGALADRLASAKVTSA